MLEERPKDYEVTIRVRNNYLLTVLRHHGHDNIAKFCRDTGFSYKTLHGFLRLEYAAFSKVTKDWRPSVKQLARLLKVEPARLFPPQHFEEALPHHVGRMEMDLAEVQVVLGAQHDPELLPDQRIERQESLKVITKAFETLTEREQRVLTLRFGLDGGKAHTYKEIGVIFGITTERIRQIEAKAIRKLKHPSRSDQLREVLPALLT